MSLAANPCGSPVSLRLEGGLAWVEADHPPVNALSHEVRQGLLGGVRQAAANAAVQAIAIGARGRTFFAGADIDELDRGVRPPGLLELVRACDAATQPVLAALHGTVFGGGVVVAYACDSCVAADTTRFALPELGLGLLPTFGGTQWLPRWLGVEAALALIVDGQEWSADDARNAGLIDHVVAADHLRAAVASCAAQGCPKRRIGDASHWRGHSAQESDSAFERRRARLAASAPDFEAAWLCLEVMQRGLALPIDEALQLEHAAFERLRTSAQSRRLRRLFFAERRLRRGAPGAAELAREILRLGADDRAALAALACRAVAERAVPDAEAFDALLVQTLQLPRHAPSRIAALLETSR